MNDKGVCRTATATPGLLIILVQHVKCLKLFFYIVNLPWLTLPPVFVHSQDQISTKIAYVKPKKLPEPIELYTGIPVVPVTNSMCTKLCLTKNFIIIIIAFASLDFMISSFI